MFLDHLRCCRLQQTALSSRREVVELSLIHSSKDFMAIDAPCMRGIRSRTKKGPLRDKRDDTHIGTIEKQYGLDLGVRSDMQLGTYLKKNNIKSLNDLVNGQ